MLTPSLENTPPAAVADPYFSLTDIPRRAQAIKKPPPDTLKVHVLYVGSSLHYNI